MNGAEWLDKTIGPPWSGLIVLALIGGTSWLFCRLTVIEWLNRWAKK